MSGKRTATIGVYSNRDMPWSNYIDEQQCLNGYFRAQGYYTEGARKIYHLRDGFKNPQGMEWDDYVVRFGHLDLKHHEPRGPQKQEQQRYVNGANALKQPPRPGNIKVGPFEIGAPNIADTETEDFKVAEWGARQLAQKRDRPFFLALGFASHTRRGSFRKSISICSRSIRLNCRRTSRTTSMTFRRGEATRRTPPIG